MSYILDALKKSEQERGHGGVPGVQTIHSSSLSYRSEKTVYWPYVLIAVVSLNLLAILYFIFDKQQSSADNTTEQAQQTGRDEYTDSDAADNTAGTSPATSTASMTTDQPPTAAGQTITTEIIEAAALDTTTITQPAAAGSALMDEDPALAQSVAAETGSEIYNSAIAADDDIIEFYDLPEDIKRQLPAIVISAHVYSSNVLQRSIVINNKFMEQGQYVIDDLMLLEITRDGAIFGFQGIRFHHGVVSSWQ